MGAGVVDQGHFDRDAGGRAGDGGFAPAVKGLDVDDRLERCRRKGAGEREHGCCRVEVNHERRTTRPDGIARKGFGERGFARRGRSEEEYPGPMWIWVLVGILRLGQVVAELSVAVADVFKGKVHVDVLRKGGLVGGVFARGGVARDAKGTAMPRVERGFGAREGVRL